MSPKPNENKVLFGFSDLYIGTFTENEDGSVTMGEPYHQRGAVGWSPEEQGSQYTFHADNVSYYNYYTTGTEQGDLVVARFDDDFKVQFMGYIETEDGGIAKVKNATKPNIYMCYEIQGDKGPERIIYYNGSMGGISRENATIEENIEVKTEKTQITFTGDNKTGMASVSYPEGSAGFEAMFTNPPAPKLPDQPSE